MITKQGERTACHIPAGSDRAGFHSQLVVACRAAVVRDTNIGHKSTSEVGVMEKTGMFSHARSGLVSCH